MAADDPIKTILHYAQALKAPRIRDSAARLAEQARDANWTHEEYLAAVLSREVAAREACGAATRIRSAGFPTRKSLEDFNFDHQPALNRDMIAHLGTGAFLAKSRNVVLLGPPGTGKTHLAIGLAIKAAQTGHRIVHHADVLTLKGSSYRLKDTGIDTLPSARADNTAQ